MISCRHVSCFQCTDETREEALAVLRLIRQSDALREHAYERGDDDASIHELMIHVLEKASDARGT